MTNPNLGLVRLSFSLPIGFFSSTVYFVCPVVVVVTFFRLSFLYAKGMIDDESFFCCFADHVIRKRRSICQANEMLSSEQSILSNSEDALGY
jgi:hypothetical protein